MTQFLPICTYDPIMAASITQSSPMYTWSPIFMGMNASPLHSSSQPQTPDLPPHHNPPVLTWAASASGA